MQAVPTDTTPYYQQQTNLDGDDYLLRFRFNSREQTWYLELLQTDGTLLAANLKLVCNSLLLANLVNTDPPLGDFIVLDATGGNAPPGLLDLDPDNGRCTLYYLEQAELAQYVPA